MEIYKKNVVFIFDEAHRSQFGEAQKNIKKRFKNYFMFGFTGTPIFPENALGSETTKSVFGRELHSYVITDAIRDEKVLKFKVDYNDVRPKFRDVEKIPHMGWNNVEQVKDMPLFEGIKNNEYFYFVHSYHVNPSNKDVIAGVCEYGYKFPCILNKDSLYATQFHPEKSGKVGLKMIENFIELI